MYSINTVNNILRGDILQSGSDAVIAHLGYDSRHLPYPEQTLFFAIRTAQGDGHKFIAEAYRKGVRHFVVQQTVEKQLFPVATLILVENTLFSLQQLAFEHRKKFSLAVIGITGSNGKTIVKEWLYQLLSQENNIVRSPRSFNSQIGVPLSVWQITAEHQMGIFEAGISQTGEMAALAKIIQPTIGILTNIGEAHDEGFPSPQRKLQEKLLLFNKAQVVICAEEFRTNTLPEQNVFSWGDRGNATLRILEVSLQGGGTTIRAYYNGSERTIRIPFTDEASVQNAITCWCTMLYLDYEDQLISERFAQLHAVDMRLQLLKGINNCTIINDSYSADLTSLSIALNFVAQQKTAQKRTVILSEFIESGKTDPVLYRIIAEQMVRHQIGKLITIGERIRHHLPALMPAQTEIHSFGTVEEFIERFKLSGFQNETVLVKGARRFFFERIVRLLETKIHQTHLEINLNAIAYNLKQYQKLLQPGTKVMAMVKAFSYGSGGSEIASILQYNNVHFLAVAYADEGLDLRKAGIELPIMVMNADVSSFSSIIENNLQPVLYSPAQLEGFGKAVRDLGLLNYPVHIEIETGMNRLGFSATDMGMAGEYLQQSPFLRVQSVFTHLASSEDAEQDAFTATQAALFGQAANDLQGRLPYPFLKHVANSAAILRHPHLHMDMVRLGIGLYGVEVAEGAPDLQPVATLRTTVAQLKQLKAGDTVSYNRRGIVREDAVIATIRIGYADGYSRRLGNGVGKVWVKGKLAPTIGTVCMDMTMIDVTGIPGIREGDEVILFGKELPLQQLAQWAGTIPYEIMTSVSQRVKRIYFQE